MKSSLFITGSSGFIASHLLQKIDIKRYKNIYCLSRNESQITTRLSAYDNFKFIKGSIYDADLYTQYLASTDTVVHLAAATGKVRLEDYFNVNAKGTKFLVQQCKGLGVQNFLHISSIAVKFPDISRYYYAQSKQQAEDAVKDSGLNFTIVRPTIVIGEGSGTWRSLSKLAKGPVTFMFGDGKAKIQPIYVEDLVGILLSIVDEGIFHNETFEIGGPEEITIEEFIRRTRQIYYKKNTRVVHLPLGLLIPVLSLMEKPFYSLLPLNVGQLSSFRYDGTIEQNRLFARYLPQLKNVNEILRSVMSNGQDCRLNDECNVFCKYLVGQKPNQYVLEKYREGHKASDLHQALNSDRFDRLLIKIAGINPLFTKLVDVYARIFSKTSVLRKKLVLLLAILESCAPTHHYLDSADSHGKTLFYIRFLLKGLLFVIFLLLSTMLFMPLRIILGAVGNRQSR